MLSIPRDDKTDERTEQLKLFDDFAQPREELAKVGRFEHDVPVDPTLSLPPRGSNSVESRAWRMFVSGKKIQRLRENVWQIGKSRKPGYHHIKRVGDRFTCSCPFWQERELEAREKMLGMDHEVPSCKHLAVMRYYIARKRTFPEPTERRKQYAQPPGYTRAQEAEALNVATLAYDLVHEIEFPQQSRGRPGATPHDLLIGLILGAYEGTSLRRTTSYSCLAHQRKLVSRVPPFASLARFMNHPETPNLLHKLVARSVAGFSGRCEAFALDSTGVSVHAFNSWLDEKPGRERGTVPRREHDWLKLHVIASVDNHAIMGAIVTQNFGKNTGDPSQALPLLQKLGDAGFRLKKLYADAAYDDARIVAEVRRMGGEPLIGQRYDRNPRPGSARGRANLRRMTEEDRASWLADYHKRNNVESVFASMKAKFDEEVRAKTDTSRQSAVLARVLAYNLSVVNAELFMNHTLPPWLDSELVGWPAATTPAPSPLTEIR